MVHDAGNLLAERLPRAAEHLAEQAPDPRRYDDPPSVHRHVRHYPPVEPAPTLSAPRTLGTAPETIPDPHCHRDQIALVRHTLDDQYRQPRNHHVHKLVDISHTTPTMLVTLGYRR